MGADLVEPGRGKGPDLGVHAVLHRQAVHRVPARPSARTAPEQRQHSGGENMEERKKNNLIFPFSARLFFFFFVCVICAAGLWAQPRGGPGGGASWGGGWGGGSPGLLEALEEGPLET